MATWTPPTDCFEPDGSLQTESWYLLIQSPLAAHLPGDLVWSIHQAYYTPQALRRHLRRRVLKVALRKQARSKLAEEFAPQFERAHQLVKKARDDLDAAYGE